MVDNKTEKDLLNTFDNLMPKEGKFLIAAEDGNLKEIKSLIEKEGVDPNFKNNEWITALHKSAINNHHKIIKYLTSLKDINVNPQNYEGSTPIFFAAALGNFEAFKTLYDNGADPHIKREDLNLDAIDITKLKVDFGDKKINEKGKQECLDYYSKKELEKEYEKGTQKISSKENNDNVNILNTNERY